MGFAKIADIPATYRALHLGSMALISRNASNRGIVKSTDGGYTWTDKGDFCTAGQWLYGPVSHDGTTVYVGAHDNKIYRSLNGGESFAAVSTQSLAPVVGASIDGNIVVFGLYGGGLKVARSINGSSFSETIFTGEGQIIGALNLGGGVILAFTHGNVYDGQGYVLGLFRSVDNGASWSYRGRIYGGTTVFDDLGAIHLGNGVVLLGTYNEGRIFKSIDAGLTWGDKGRLASTSAYARAFCKLSDGRVLAAEKSATWGRVFVSEDSGESWSLYQDLGTLSPQGIDAKSIFQLSDGSVVLVASYSGGWGVYRDMGFAPLPERPVNVAVVPGDGKNTLSWG